MNYACLKEYGIDYKKGLARCLNDEGLYQMLLGMFLSDDSMDRARAGFDSGDYKAVFMAMHELKGACGNADLTELYEAVCPLVELLRGGNGSREEIGARLSLAEEKYARAKEGIKRATSE